MQPRRDLTQSNNSVPKQVTHILVAGLWTSDKHKLIRHVSEVPLEEVDITSDLIPAELPKLLMGELHVDTRLTTCIWGAPANWRHDYVNYLVNIKSILNDRGDRHRVMGMVVVVDSVRTFSSEDEGKLVRLIQSDWQLPYIIIASHPYAPHARHCETIRDEYNIAATVPILPYDLSQQSECRRIFIELMYHMM